MTPLAPNVTVAVAQIDIALLDRKLNAERMAKHIDEIGAARPEVDLILFPELANIGYVRDRQRDFGGDYIEAAEPVPGPTTETLGAAAKRNSVTVIVGIAETHPVIPHTLYNTAVVIGPDGEIIGSFRKMHIAGEEKHFFRGGNSAPVFETPFGRIGVAICYDTVFSELTRILALKGAHIMCFLYNAWTHVEHPDLIKHLAAARAAENRMFVVAANRVGEDFGRVFFGGSAIAGPQAELYAEGGTEEEILIATLPGKDLAKERGLVPVFIDRRPELYGLITADHGRLDSQEYADPAAPSYNGAVATPTVTDDIVPAS